MVGAFYFYSMRVTVLGIGKVGQSLIAALENIQVLHQVYCRHLDAAAELKILYPHIAFTDQLDLSASQSDLFIMAVSDEAIAELSAKIKLPTNAILAHSSGTTALETLTHERTAVFYPLQTFAKGKITELKEVPILLEASDALTYQKVEDLARRLSRKVIPANSNIRAQIHLAAVFASNFSNRMIHTAEKILAPLGHELDLLEPLIMRSIENIFRQGSNAALTGPAQREDHQTIEKQKALLSQNPELQELYQKLTKYTLSTKTTKQK